MVELTQEEQRRLRKDLIALDCAAALYERLCGARQGDEFEAKARQSGNALASALAARLPVYTHNEQLTVFQRFYPSELREASFNRGGRELRLPDGRAVMRLVVRLSDLRKAIENPQPPALGLEVVAAAQTELRV